jgi:hypothetical protein
VVECLAAIITHTDTHMCPCLCHVKTVQVPSRWWRGGLGRTVLLRRPGRRRRAHDHVRQLRLLGAHSLQWGPGSGRGAGRVCLQAMPRSSSQVSSSSSRRRGGWCRASSRQQARQRGHP